MSTEPKLIKAGSPLLKLGLAGQPPLVDCRVVAEDQYQEIIELLERAASLVGNPASNISSSVDLACDKWQSDYAKFQNT